MSPKVFNISELVNSSGCFDLQFRKDTRHERTGSPTYYRWKLEFVITGPKEHGKIMQKVKKELQCGDVYTTQSQARFSVQKIDDLYNTVVPYFTRHSLGGGGLYQNKKKDFQLWCKAVEIIYNNKGIYLSKWEKNDIKKLIEIHKIKLASKPTARSSKWMKIAKTLAK